MRKQNILFVIALCFMVMGLAHAQAVACVTNASCLQLNSHTSSVCDQYITRDTGFDYYGISNAIAPRVYFPINYTLPFRYNVSGNLLHTRFGNDTSQIQNISIPQDCVNTLANNISLYFEAHAGYNWEGSAIFLYCINKTQVSLEYVNFTSITLPNNNPTLYGYLSNQSLNGKYVSYINLSVSGGTYPVNPVYAGVSINYTDETIYASPNQSLESDGLNKNLSFYNPYPTKIVRSYNVFLMSSIQSSINLFASRAFFNSSYYTSNTILLENKTSTAEDSNPCLQVGNPTYLTNFADNDFDTAISVKQSTDYWCNRNSDAWQATTNIYEVQMIWSTPSTTLLHDYYNQNWPANFNTSAPTYFPGYANTTNQEFNYSTSCYNPTASCWINYSGVMTSTSCAGVKTWRNITAGNYSWGVFMNYSDGYSEYINTSFSPIVITNYSYTNPGTILSNSLFNASMFYDSSYFTSISFILRHNASVYSSTVQGSGNNKYIINNLNLPYSTTNRNITFNYSISAYSADGAYSATSINNNQSLVIFLLDDCSSYSNVIVNWTLFDEDSRTKLYSPAYNNSFDLYAKIYGLGSGYVELYNNKSNINSSKLCSNNNLGTSGLYLTSTMRYGSTGHVSEYSNLQKQNLTAIPIEISLYDLLTTSSQEFLINYKDENFIPYPDAVIEIHRQYLPIGAFIQVEAPKTDTSGNTIVHLVPGSQVYNILVKKDNVLLTAYYNVIPVCTYLGDCKINLNAMSSSETPGGHLTVDGIYYSDSYNKTSRTYTFYFQTQDSTTKSLNISISQFGNISAICSEQIVGATGTLTCIIPADFGNNTAKITVQADNSTIYQNLINVGISKNAFLPNIRYLLAAFLILTLVLMGAASSAVVALIGLLIGIIFAAVFYLIDVGSIFGGASALIWFVIAIGILLWKAGKAIGGENG